PERRDSRRRARVRGDEDGGARRADAGIDGAADLGDERHVDRPVAQLRVETADDESARTRELELDAAARRASRRGNYDPRARNTHADLETLALVRRARRAGACGDAGKSRGDDDDATSHGTLRNH